MKYRREIDGLRALAVLPVILYHAGFSIFGGGYAGVDIFFVISGYLITTILINELDDGRFSILGFYERRARRILPALFAVMLVCLPFAWTWMLPAAFIDFAQSNIAVIFFVSNILFWRESGYFDAASEEKPLLHTWSLAVEEQYYLLFPLALLVLWPLGRQRVVLVIATVAALSLLLSEWGWRNAPSANFYLAPTRAWELLAGSLCAFAIQRYGQKVRNWPAAMGLILIIGIIFLYDTDTPFPSIFAVAPVGGTVLIILFAGPGSIAARILSHPVLVGIGLVSYSAYLWHQPLFAFARIRSITEPPPALMLALSITTLLLAYLSWRFIEQPFRGRTPVLAPTRSGVFGASAVGAIFFVGFGLFGVMQDGAAFRLPQSVQKVVNFRPGDTSDCHNGLTAAEIRAGRTCRLGATEGPTHLAILGDSHVSRLHDALSETLATAGISGVTFNGSWCVPLVDFATDAPGKNGCLDRTNAAFDHVLSDGQIEFVVLFAEWSAYTEGYRWTDKSRATYLHDTTGVFDFASANPAGNAAHFEAALKTTLARIDAAGKTALIILPTPEFEFHAADTLAKQVMFTGFDIPDLQLPLEEYDARNSASRKSLIRMTDAMGLSAVDPRLLLCNVSKCGYATQSGLPLFSDSNHLTYDGARIIVDALVEKMHGLASGTTAHQQNVGSQ